jgi:hypothetical protein
LTFVTATLDHIIPSSAGGTANIWNFAVACRRCNNERGNADFFETLRFYGADQKKIHYYNAILGNYYHVYKIHSTIAQIKSNRDLFTNEQFKAALSVLGRLIRPLSLGHRLKHCAISWSGRTRP